MSYAVSLNGSVIYTPAAAAIDPRFSLLSCVLTEEENKIPKKELLLPPDQIGFQSAGAGPGTVELTDGDELLFTGRIRQYKDNFWQQRSVTCEGALGYLADLPDVTTVASDEAPITVQAAFSALLADYAAKADAGRKIYAGTCDVNGTITKTATGQVWDSIDGWVSEFGGFLTLRRTDGKLHLDYKKDRPGLDTSQVIRFSVNMLETLDRLTDASKIETGVLAIGGTPEGASAPVTLNGYPGTENGVLFADTRSVYGSIYKRVEFKDALTQEALYAAAQAYLEGVAAAAVSLKLSAVENKLLGLAPHHMKISASYQAISEPHGLNAAFPLKKRVLNILAPESSSTEYGAAETALTEKQASWNRKTGKIELKAEEAFQKANTAKITADTAKTTAQQANTTAVAASETAAQAKQAADAAASAADLQAVEAIAQAARSEASDAADDAADAVSAAQAAQTTAGNAQTAASNAASAAETAQTTANAASQAAGNAQSTADTARTEAAAAQTAANNAASAAASAQSTANTANSNASAALTKINAVADYIQETGTSGIWTWEKWASGKAVCRGSHDFSIASGAFSAYGNIYSLTGDTIYFPSGFFVGVPFVLMDIGVCSLSSAVIWLGHRYNPTAAEASFQLFRHAQLNASCTIGINVKAEGQWK